MGAVMMDRISYDDETPVAQRLDRSLRESDELCRRWDGEIISREGQEIKWVRASRLGDYPMPPADAPLIPMLRDLLG